MRTFRNNQSWWFMAYPLLLIVLIILFPPELTSQEEGEKPAAQDAAAAPAGEPAPAAGEGTPPADEAKPADGAGAPPAEGTPPKEEGAPPKDEASTPGGEAPPADEPPVEGEEKQPPVDAKKILEDAEGLVKDKKYGEIKGLIEPNPDVIDSSPRLAEIYFEAVMADKTPNFMSIRGKAEQLVNQDKKHTWANYVLGRYWAEGAGKKTDLAKALKFLAAAKEGKNPPADITTVYWTVMAKKYGIYAGIGLAAILLVLFRKKKPQPPTVTLENLPSADAAAPQAGQPVQDAVKPPPSPAQPPPAGKEKKPVPVEKPAAPITAATLPPKPQPVPPAAAKEPPKPQPQPQATPAPIPPKAPEPTPVTIKPAPIPQPPPIVPYGSLQAGTGMAGMPSRMEKPVEPVKKINKQEYISGDMDLTAAAAAESSLGAARRPDFPPGSDLELVWERLKKKAGKQPLPLDFEDSKEKPEMAKSKVVDTPAKGNEKSGLALAPTEGPAFDKWFGEAEVSLDLTEDSMREDLLG